MIPLDTNIGNIQVINTLGRRRASTHHLLRRVERVLFKRVPHLIRRICLEDVVRADHLPLRVRVRRAHAVRKDSASSDCIEQKTGDNSVAEPSYKDLQSVDEQGLGRTQKSLLS